jgi:hypothetical protein
MCLDEGKMEELRDKLKKEVMKACRKAG